MEYWSARSAMAKAELPRGRGLSVSAEGVHVLGPPLY